MLNPTWVVKDNAEKTVKNFVEGMVEHLRYRWFKAHCNNEFAAWLIKEMPLKGFNPFLSSKEVLNIRKYIREHASELYDLALTLATGGANKKLKRH